MKEVNLEGLYIVWFKFLWYLGEVKVIEVGRRVLVVRIDWEREEGIDGIGDMLYLLV